MTRDVSTTNMQQIPVEDELFIKLDLVRKWRKSRESEGLPKRAFVVEFAGMPKAGKSSTIGTIRHFLNYGHKLGGGAEQGIKVHTPAEGVSLRTPQVLKANLHRFNIWAGAYALQELFQAHHDPYNDVVILDRGPWDAGCWLTYWKTVPSLDTDIEKHIEEVIQFLHLPVWLTMSDLHVVFVVDPKKAAQREDDRRLVSFGGTAHNASLMHKLKNIYEEDFKGLLSEKQKQCPHIGDKAALLLDTSKLKPKEIAKSVLARVFEVLERKIEEPHLIEHAEVKAILHPVLDTVTISDVESDACISQFVHNIRDFSAGQRGKMRGALNGFPKTFETKKGSSQPNGVALRFDAKSLNIVLEGMIKTVTKDVPTRA